ISQIIVFYLIYLINTTKFELMKSINTSCWRGCSKFPTYFHMLQECNKIATIWKTIQHLYKWLSSFICSSPSLGRRGGAKTPVSNSDWLDGRRPSNELIWVRFAQSSTQIAQTSNLICRGVFKDFQWNSMEFLRAGEGWMIAELSGPRKQSLMLVYLEDFGPFV
uniref:Uncharacterized protein n=1 Tax=Salvator merianae TaxID=96440 RepID=A0A8D0EFN1_SALMN